jgi:hypothetical protein
MLFVTQYMLQPCGWVKLCEMPFASDDQAARITQRMQERHAQDTYCFEMRRTSQREPLSWAAQRDEAAIARAEVK